MRFALDRYGRYIHVSNARKTETYYCPFCGCKLQVRCKDGVFFFDVAPGAAHAHKQCQNPRHRFSDLWMTSTWELEKDLLSSTAYAGSKNLPGRKEKGEGGLLTSMYSGSHYSVGPLRFLSDFRKERIYTWPADTELNGYKLMDIFVSKNNAAVLMDNNKPLGFRIVDVTFYRLVGTNTLRFALYSTNEEGKKIRYFDLFVEDGEEYRMLSCEVLANRRARYYIAGIWESVDCDVRNSGDWSVIGIQKARFNNKNQFYRYVY